MEKLVAEAEQLDAEAVGAYRKGHYSEAVTLAERGLVLTRKLYPVEKYPAGHAHLAMSLNNLGSFLKVKGELSKADPFLRDALAMRQRLHPAEKYPDGHPELAGSLNNLGCLLRAKEEVRKAEPFFRDALTMHRRLDHAFAMSASEAELLNLAATRSGTEHGLLDVTASQPANQASDTYADVWVTKGTIAQTLTRRSALQHTATADPKTRARLLDLIRTRQDVARLALAPSSPNRDETLRKLTDEATAALMKLFYHGLWVENLPPAQALRRAQLALLRHPDARTALAKTPRGPNFDKEVKRVDAVPAASTTQPIAEVRYWAAFTVSGVGR